MRAKHIFFLTVGAVTLVITLVGAASVFMLENTVIVLAFDGAPPGEEAAELTRNILDERIKTFGGDFDVRSSKVEHRDGQFVVTLRGHQDLSAFSEVLLRRNEAHLYLAADAQAHETFQRGGRIPEGFRRDVITHERLKLGTWGETHKTQEAILLREQPEMVVARLKAVNMTRQGWLRRPVISIQFDERQGKQFAELTRKHTGERLALSIEGEVFSAPTIQGEITDGVVQIRNMVYAAKAYRLYQLLRIGALPAPLRVVEAAEPAGRDPALVARDRPPPRSEVAAENK